MSGLPIVIWSLLGVLVLLGLGCVLAAWRGRQAEQEFAPLWQPAPITGEFPAVDAGSAR